MKIQANPGLRPFLQSALALGLFMSATIAQAADADFCDISDTSDEKLIEIPGNNPGAYLRFSEDGKYALGSGGHGMLFDLSESPAKLSRVPTRDESFLREGWVVSPNHGRSSHFFRLEDLAKEKATATSPKLKTVNHGNETDGEFVDNEHNEYYHSTGVRKEGNKTYLRNALWSSKTYRDYTIESDASGKPTKVTYSDVSDLCKNIQRSMNIPILSADGNEVALGTRGGTKIYRIKADGTCDETTELGYVTGKVTFSPTEKKSDGSNWSRYLAFNYDSVPQGVQGAPPSAAYNRGVYVYDRETKQTRLISNPDTDQRASYPGITSDGRVMYAAVRGGRYYFISRKLNAIRDEKKAIKTSVCADCFDTAKKRENALNTLVSVWKDACPQMEAKSGDGGKRVIQLITKEQCQTLVQNKANAQNKTLLQKTCEALQ